MKQKKITHLNFMTFLYIQPLLELPFNLIIQTLHLFIHSLSSPQAFLISFNKVFFKYQLVTLFHLIILIIVFIVIGFLWPPPYPTTFILFSIIRY